MRAGLSMSFSQIHTFVHPQAVLLDASSQEDEVLLRALLEEAAELSVPVVRLPDNALESTMWITRLDSGSLRGALRICSNRDW